MPECLGTPPIALLVHLGAPVPPAFRPCMHPPGCQWWSPGTTHTHRAPAQDRCTTHGPLRPGGVYTHLGTQGGGHTRTSAWSSASLNLPPQLSRSQHTGFAAPGLCVQRKCPAMLQPTPLPCICRPKERTVQAQHGHPMGLRGACSVQQPRSLPPPEEDSVRVTRRQERYH